MLFLDEVRHVEASQSEKIKVDFLVGGGCSIPNAVRTIYDEKGLYIDGILLNLDGSRFVKDNVKNDDLTVPMTTDKHVSDFFESNSDDDLVLHDDDLQSTNGSSDQMSLKRKRTKSDIDSGLILPPPPPPSIPLPSSSSSTTTTTAQPPSPPLSTTSLSAPTSATEVKPLLRHYAHVCGVNINETVLENAELCGTNLAVKLMQMGADSILEEIQQTVVVIPTP